MYGSPWEELYKGVLIVAVCGMLVRQGLFARHLVIFRRGYLGVCLYGYGFFINLRLDLCFHGCYFSQDDFLVFHLTVVNEGCSTRWYHCQNDLLWDRFV